MSIGHRVNFYEPYMPSLTKVEKMANANDKVENHSLSCPFCNKSFNAKGKIPMEIICPHCRTLLNVKNPWSIRRGTREKRRTKKVE